MQMFKMTKARWLIAIVLALLVVVIGIIPVLQPHDLNKSEFSKLPDPQFITRSGTRLMLAGHPFRFAGANMHWLALEDSGAYASPFSVRDGFATARTMGLTVIRAHSLGISVGCPNCIEPTQGTFNQTSFKYIDYAVMMARQYGMRLIIPLTDNYRYTTGGKHTFTDWLGISDENQFYSDPRAITAFELYIKTLLTHVNSYTGEAYKDDPTIMAWETGNELDPPTAWTMTISTYIKSIDHTHLIIDGRQGIDPSAAQLPNVDILSDHYYPMNVTKMTADANSAKRFGKAFITGEFQWNETYGGDPLQQFLSAIQMNTEISGDLFWELWPHNEMYGYDSNQVQFTLHYPGDDSAMQTQANLLRDYAYKMASLPIPAIGVPPGPQLNVVIRTDTANTLIWQGSVGAANYTVERSASSGGPWETICDRCTTDLSAPWTDSSPPTTANCWYRIIPYNSADVAGAPSNVYQASSTKTTFDDLNDWTLTAAHSSELSFQNNPDYMNGDSSVVERETLTQSYITWKQANITSFQALSYFWPEEHIVDFSIYTSTDGNHWVLGHPTISTIKSNWLEHIYSLKSPTKTNYVKIVWSANNTHPWTPALGEVSISSN